MWLRNVWTAGIDWKLPGNGGPQCASYLSPQRQILEVLAGLTISALSGYFGYILHSRPSVNWSITDDVNKLKSVKKWSDTLLALMSLTYLMEIGYKFVTEQAIFSVNPCHCMCLVQIFILVNLSRALDNGDVPSTSVMYVYRIHLYCMHGPLMAVIFPVTNTLFLPGEVATYWIEHALLLTIPVFLLKFAKLTVPSSSLADSIGWGLMSYGIWGAFHFVFLQPLASLTMANLNSMLCPAISDPFRGPNYRSYAIVHQLFITVISGCLVNLLGKREESARRQE